MKNLLVRRLVFFSFGVVALVVGIALPSQALDRTWIGGNVDWVDAGSTANWNPADEPDSDDRAIFNTANSVNLGSNNSINGLALSGGIDLFTNEFDLSVDGLVEVGGANTNLFIGGAASTLTANNVTINSSADIEMNGGVLSVHDFTLAIGLLDINVGGELLGNGTVNLSEPPAVPTTLLVNDGSITANSTPLFIFGEPPTGTLSINAPIANGNGRVDLDGAAEAGVVNVNRNQTLDLNVAFADSFNGAINLAHNSTFDSLNAWTLAGGSIVANNGFVAGGIGVPDIPADVSFIAGGLLTQTSGNINVADTDGTLQLDSAFTMSGGSFTNSGTVIFNGVTSITTAAGYAPSALNSQTIVNANVTINDGTTNFNWDGTGAADTTVNNGTLLSITAAQVDTTDNVFGGDIILNDGSDLAVNVTATSWTLGGAMTKNDAGTSTVSGDRIVITGVANANVGTLDMPAVTTSATADINVTGTLTFGSSSELAGGDFDGAGLLRMEGTSTVSADTTIAVDTFDWDGLGTGTAHTINAGVDFAINSTTFDSDGDMDDPINLAGADSRLLVNVDPQWTMNNTINANNAGSGTALIGGASRLILSGASAVFNVNGNTDVGSHITFGAGSLTDIDAGFTLALTGPAADNIYSGGTIVGAGTFRPGPTNTVIADTTINVDNFNFDSGAWTIQSGAELTFNANDYEPDSLTNSFENTITLNNGAIFANSPDPAIVMNGTLNMNATGGNGAEWDGDAVQIGNDVGVLDANVNVTGDGNTNSQGRFFAPVTFMSDADVEVPAGASLVLNRPVAFNSVNAANNAEFTGAGTMAFADDVTVNEATTLNMVGGTVDLDGNDGVGDTVAVNAPLTINAATVSNFGRANGGGGINTITVNNSVSTGILTVNLDDPAAEWTLNGPGVMNLVNDNAPATLLAGSDVKINGTLNVTGDVRTTARLDIAGIVNINTAAEPLRLAGGSGDPNTIAGGTISGVGILGADTGIDLHGSGTISTTVDFDGSAGLFADNGMLTLNGPVVDVGIIGALGPDAILNVVNAWNSSVAGTVINEFGSEIRGGTITVDNALGVIGKGLTSARVINNTRIGATRHFVGDSGTHVFQTVGNDNDWDGAGGTGTLLAEQDHTLELRDNATFGFTGTVQAAPGGRVFANGFALDFNPGSNLNLTAGTYESTSSTDLGGTVTVSGGAPSTIKVANNFFLTFETGSTTTLDGNLTLINNNINIEQGAVFVNGGGALNIPDGSHMVADNLANIGVLLDMQGAFRPGNFEGIGRVDLFDYQQGNTGELYVEITGTALNAFDRLVASGDVVLDGYLNIDIDEVSPGVPFVPLLGQTFNIITGNTVTGAFDYADVSGMPAGLAFHIEYLANAVQLQVVNKPFFSADFDDDGDVDATDLAIWQGAYDLNQLGDADGDNDSDGRDFLLWQQQFGSAPLVALNPASTAVPEPANITLALITMVSCGLRRRVKRGICLN